MTGTRIKKGNLETFTGRAPHEQEGTDWTDAFTSPGIPKSDRTHQKLGERPRANSLTASQGTSLARTFISDF